MSLRYRIFLWVSGLFIVVSIGTYLTENFVANRELKKAQGMLRQKILAMSETSRNNMQNFLGIMIAEDEIKIDAILNNISSFSPQTLRFGPTDSNLLHGTWGDASDLLIEYKWIDFLQNSNENRVTAGIMPEQTVMNSFYRIDIDQDLSWVYRIDEKGIPKPYLGLRVPYSLTTEMDGQKALFEHLPGLVPAAFLFFDLEEFQQLSADAPLFKDEVETNWPPIPVKWSQGYELDVTPFVATFERAKHLVQTKQLTPPSLTEEQFKEKIHELMVETDGRYIPIPQETLLSTVGGEEISEERFEEIALRYTQISVIWLVIAMYDTGIFGNHLLSFPAPAGGLVFAKDHLLGVGVNSKDVLFENKIFDDNFYYTNHHSKNFPSNLGTSLAVISVKNSVFLGNTAQFCIDAGAGHQVGYLTVGVSADAILQKLVLAMHQTALLIHGGKPLAAYSAEGEKIKNLEKCALPFAQMLEEESGIVSWQGENYYFMRIQPFPAVDLHFFLFNPEAKEFALLNDLEKGATRVVDAIRLDIHLAGLLALCIIILLLHNVTRNITRPIVKLAALSNEVAEGGLDKIQLPLSIAKHRDEIAVLCNSFEAMIKGLQEKEKVRGVLNKVVSQEIAEEILKGSIRLGGEVKKVTVLFADIRNFTKLAQEMAPSVVVDMLNTCMTKISAAVDSNKGVIDKYVGDEAMALFGAPLVHQEDAFHAIKSGLEMIEAIKAWNKERTLQGHPSIEVGVGIHTGEMLAGNMGAENRLNYTVIGSSVNLAARLCGSAKGMEVLVTQTTLEEPFVKERVTYEKLDPMSFKGFDHPIDVFRIIGLIG